MTLPITRNDIRWILPSRTRPDRTHEITLDPGRAGGYACTCEARKQCWAIHEVKARTVRPIIRVTVGRRVATNAVEV